MHGYLCMSLIDENNFDTVEARDRMLNAEDSKENNKIEDKDPEQKMQLKKSPRMEYSKKHSIKLSNKIKNQRLDKLSQELDNIKRDRIALVQIGKHLSNLNDDLIKTIKLTTT